MLDVDVKSMTLVASPSAGLMGGCIVPGDKSIAHRAIILAAMADGTSTVVGIPDGDDVQRTLAAVEQLGAQVVTGCNGVEITGAPWRSSSKPIDCGNSGTAARLLAGAIAGMPGVKATLAGDRSLSRRPMRRLFQPLRQMGAEIETTEGDTLPAVIIGRELNPIGHRNVPASAQVKTAIMLAALNTVGVTRVFEPEASRDHGEILLPLFGCPVGKSNFGGCHAVSLEGPASLKPTNIEVAGDISSAAFLLVAGLIVPGSRVCVENMLLNTSRTGLLDTLEMMGATIIGSQFRQICGESVAAIEVRSSALKAVDVPASLAPSMIDEYPIAAVAAANASGTSIFRGLGELRHKESDRLERLASCLAACGVAVNTDGDDLIVHGSAKPHGNCLIDCHGDHRIAMAMAVMGLTSHHDISIANAEMIATSFPTFVQLMRGLGARLEWSK